MPLIRDVRAFLEQQDRRPVIDVRSPGEFQSGHISGANNVPLFDDAERAQVGTAYRRADRQAAVKLGLDIVGPKMRSLVQSVETVSAERDVLVHCWRGGMRSSAFAWLLETCDYQTVVLQGGYKAFRREVHRCLTEPRNVVVLGGLSGTGKTRLLQELHDAGDQVVDLEQLARHRGSAFGGIDQPPQPTVEQFENDLFQQWRSLNPDRPVWMEDESRKIGHVAIPEPIWRQMRQAPLISLEVDRAQRRNFLVEEYGQAAGEDLAIATAKINKRLGNERFQLALQAIADNELHTLADILLDYYDKAYHLARQKHPRDRVTSFPMDCPAQTSLIPRLCQLASDMRLIAAGDGHLSTGPMNGLT